LGGTAISRGRGIETQPDKFEGCELRKKRIFSKKDSKKTPTAGSESERREECYGERQFMHSGVQGVDCFDRCGSLSCHRGKIKGEMKGIRSVWDQSPQGGGKKE